MRERLGGIPEFVQVVESGSGVGLAWLPCWMVARHVRDGQLTSHPPAKTRAAIDALAAEAPKMIAPIIA